ncbi:MAG TPA: acyl-CoA dehydratase activase [Phycisphaerae bacterium]|nr:acyl-CoA dehydratase activase [Phycisphaerae bacterium]
MKAAGLDIGSRTIKLVVIGDGGGLVSSSLLDTTPDVTTDCRRLLGGVSFDALVVTGYGRSLAEVEFDAPSVTEIKAFARGAEAVCPGCRTVLDIGGQDTKAIALDGKGRPIKFEMNDRCAAGAGRFIEIMAAALKYELNEFGPAALRSAANIALNSMCTVFAESEVIGLMTRGIRREDIAGAVHRAIMRRTVGMLRQVSVHLPMVFAGGAARNPCLVALLEDAVGTKVCVPDDPQMVGALGAALIAEPRMSRQA